MKLEGYFACTLALSMLASQPLWSANSPSFQAIRSEILSLRPKNLTWHSIAWKNSLVEAVREARRAHKPIFVWAFIHLPRDERC